MSGFFQGFNTVRALILLFLIGSIPMGMQVWEREQKIRDLADQMGYDRSLEPVDLQNAPLTKKYESIVSMAKQHTALQAALKGEGIKGQVSPLSYIRETARHPRINLGRVEVKTSTKDLGGGKVDNIYKISPQDAKKTYSRESISNFLYQLEAESRRVRVTSLSVDATDAQGRRPDPEELPSDNWTFDCEITIREQEGGR